MKALERRRLAVLKAMADCTDMEYGCVREERRPLSGGGRSRSYFQHQVWEHGRNRSQRLGEADVAMVRKAVEGRLRFEALAREFVDLTVALSRSRADGAAKAERSPRRWRRPALRGDGVRSVD